MTLVSETSWKVEKAGQRRKEEEPAQHLVRLQTLGGVDKQTRSHI